MKRPVVPTDPVSRETGSDPAASGLVERLAVEGVALPAATAEALVALIDRLLAEPQNLTAITDRQQAIERHLADSLVALALPEVAAATELVDVGSGGGFPVLPLAAALPGATATAVESERAKAAWLERCRAFFPNLRVVADRSEHLAAAECEGFDLATVRAVAAPSVALELTAPLVGLGGHVVLWRSADGDPALDEAAAVAAAELGLTPLGRREVAPFPGARRLLDRYRKDDPTPARYPRRAGIAAKRPLGTRP